MTPQKVRFYGYDKCSTCRKAEKFLKENQLEFEKSDITTDAPSVAELEVALADLQGQIKKLFNTSGVAYREMKLSERLPEMSNSDCLQMLSQNGRLVKRPFVVLPKQRGSTPSTLVGFHQQTWSERLLTESP